MQPLRALLRFLESSVQDSPKDVPFTFFAPLSFFQKADAADGKQRRIAGIISTELKDKQDEVILQRGLDFDYFLTKGWFNDNHSARMADVVGYPDKIQKFQKGDVLPDGSKAAFNGTWAEGHLLDTDLANRIWQVGMSLQKSGSARRLGFSIEGGVQERTGPGRKTVTKAIVRHVAITHVPVGEGTRMEMLVKALSATPAPTAPGTSVATAGPVTGEGAGAVLMPKHLEEAGQINFLETDKDKDNDKDEDKVSKSDALAAIQNRFGCDRDTAERAYGTLIHLEQQGLLR